MNVKNKIIALVMSFVICFGTVSNSFCNDKESINGIQPLVVDGGIISVPMLATVSALAVGTGIVIKNSDDIYDLGRMFYDYVQSNNAMTWEMVTGAFAMGVTVKNNLVSVDNNFLDIVKGFFDNKFSNTSEDILIEGMPKDLMLPYTKDTNINFSLGNSSIHISYYSDSAINVRILDTTGKELCNYKGLYLYNSSNAISKVGFNLSSDRVQLVYSIVSSPDYYRTKQNFYGDFSSVLDSQISFPYSGGYDWGKAEDKKENDSIALPIPGDLGNLVGQTSDDFWSNDKDLAGTNPITRPNIENPSIDVTDDVFIGGTTSNPSVPNEGIWSTIKDFVVSLVVPSDTFWTDTFNGFRDNFSKNFPMLDMSKFDSLAVGGKPFPNLYAYDSKIVDGDVINSIVDWLRPIIAGFIMICLMFFNYRKIYKLIRNTEPFGGIAQGSSDFRTGLSAPPINNGLDSNPMGDLRDTLFDMRNEILRRENSK